MEALVWMRVPGDLVFTVGVVAFVIFMVRALFGRHRQGDTADTPFPDLEPVVVRGA
jgi:nitric oxide reductase subunit B